MVNALEKKIHDILIKYPKTKQLIVHIYQRIFSLLPLKDFGLVDNVTLKGCFFGFHDKCPWSFDNRYLLVHRFDCEQSFSEIENNKIEIGCVCIVDTSWKYFPLTHSKAWSWQQGTSMQWVGSSLCFMVNDFLDACCVSKMIDICGNVHKYITKHICDVTNNGNFAFSVSFARFGYGMKGYGYNFSNELYHEEMNDITLSRINLHNEKIETLFDLNFFIDNFFEDTMSESFHFFSHCLSSPSSKRIAFFHRWLTAENILYTRMYICNLDGTQLIKFPVKDCSHISWYDDQIIFAYCQPYECTLGYYFLYVCEEEFLLYKICLDGHPQVSHNKSYIITDTYPDRFRRQHLLLFDLNSHTTYTLYIQKIPFMFRGPRRCDFHPRWSPNNMFICFDSVYDNVRSLSIIRNPLNFN